MKDALVKCAGKCTEKKGRKQNQALVNGIISETIRVIGTTMNYLTDRMKALLNERDLHSFPKGEVWLGGKFLEKAGFDDTLDNHFRLAGQLNHDMVSLPVSEDPESAPDMGYRYFRVSDITPDLRSRTSLLAVVVDGPFQRMVNRRGLMDVLMDMIREPEETEEAYSAEMKIALELIGQSLEKGVDAVIIADDLAGDRAPLANPKYLEPLCTPFYKEAVSAIRKAECMSFLHSCGNLGQLAPLIASWDLDGLAAIQICNNDIPSLEKEIGCLFMAGIDAQILGDDTPPADEMEALAGFVSRFARERRLILSSSCGLYNPDFWGRLQRVYEELEKKLKM